MIDINKIKIIKPSTKMPKPGEFFLIVTGSAEKKEIYPASLKHYSTPELFYYNCVVFNKIGEVVPAKNDYATLLGWAEMLPDTKCFTITEINSGACLHGKFNTECEICFPF